MNFTSLIDYINDLLRAGKVAENSQIVAMFRNTDFPLDSETAWRKYTVVDFECSDTHVDLYTNDPRDKPALTLSEFIKRTNALPQKNLESELFMIEGSKHDGDEWEFQLHIPAIANAYNANQGVIAVVAYYDGCEDELG